MKREFLCVAVGMLAACAGCQPKDPYAKVDLGPARSVVQTSLANMGGADRWANMGPFTAVVVISNYDASGKMAVDEQSQVIDLQKGSIQASGKLPEGAWTAAITQGKRPEFESVGFTAPDAFKRRVWDNLYLSLHRLRGPLNLMYYGERATAVSKARVQGMDLCRVGVAGGKDRIKAYYFDAQDSLLCLAAAVGDAPNQEGAVTTYTWKLLPNGLQFPVRIAVNQIGQDLLLGGRPIFSVEYRNVRIQPAAGR
jgi:hypothetical protein